jgi:Uma2 family endonuclease
VAAATSLIHFDGERLNIPRSALEHEGFRRWVTSADLPAGVRASFVKGEVFFQMSPESAETHNKVKGAVTADLIHFVRERNLGEVYPDGMLLTHEAAGLSTEPDLLFASWGAFESGRLRLVPKASRHDDYAELVGTPDLVVEIVSDSSVQKDLIALKEGYFRAAIPEYWVIDARGEAVSFQILTLGAEGYVAAAAPREPQTSRVLGSSFRVERTRNRAGRWDYCLRVE